jgi:uncharacterized protein
MSHKMRCKFVDWDEVYSMCKDLARLIDASQFRPDTLVSLARSGFVPGRLLSDFMGVTDLISLKVEHWLDTTGQHKDEATIPYLIPLKLEGKKVLVVDDIVDTGKSMNVSVEYVKQYDPSAVKTAVMQYITSSIHKPDYYVRTVSDWIWFIYPWNCVEDLCNLFQRLIKTDLKKDWASEDIRKGMLDNFELAVSKEQVDDILKTLVVRKKIEKPRNGRDFWKIKA